MNEGRWKGRENLINRKRKLLLERMNHPKIELREQTDLKSTRRHRNMRREDEASKTRNPGKTKFKRKMEQTKKVVGRRGIEVAWQCLKVPLPEKKKKKERENPRASNSIGRVKTNWPMIDDARPNVVLGEREKSNIKCSDEIENIGDVPRAVLHKKKKKVGIKRASGHKGAATATCGYFNPIQVQLSKNKLRPKIS